VPAYDDEKYRNLQMADSIFRSEAIAEKKKGDFKLQESFKIIKLPTKLILYTTGLLTIAGFAWACVAKIPIIKPGAAVVFDINNSTVLGAGASGKIISIPEDFRKEHKAFFDKIFRIQQNPNMPVSVTEVQEIVSTLLSLANLNTYNKLGKMYTTFDSLHNISQGTKYHQVGEIIAVIYSDATLQDLLDQLTNSTSQYLQNKSQYNISSNLDNSYQKILKSQEKIITIFQQLEDKQYVSSTDLLSQRSQAVSLKSQISQSKSQAIQASQQIKLAEQSINSSLREFIGKFFIFSENDGWIATTQVGQRTLVQAGDVIATQEVTAADAVNELPAQIIGVINSSTLNFVKVGDRAVLTPLGINKAEYGGMQGKIISIIPYGESVKTLQNLTGISTLANNIINQVGNNPNLVLVQMEYSNNKKTSYKWTMSKVPQRKTHRGDFMTMTIETEFKTPLELAIPTIKTFLGLDGPTTFSNPNSKI
jgi:hypothetical protein